MYIHTSRENVRHIPPNLGDHSRNYSGVFRARQQAGTVSVKRPLPAEICKNQFAIWQSVVIADGDGQRIHVLKYDALLPQKVLISAF